MSGAGRSRRPPRTAITESRRRSADRRRSLTMVHIDLVGSTELGEAMDPEDLRDVVLTYHDLCDQAVERYGGRVGSRAGDGLMVFFGLPHSHEDDALRACLAGLAIIEAMRPFSVEVRDTMGVSLDVRIGIHTGPVVVTEVGGRPDAIGSAANLATRIEASGRPGVVTVSGATRQLVADDFLFTHERTVHVKGVVQPIEVCELAVRGGFFDRVEPLLPFVGRTDELARLLERWQSVHRREPVDVAATLIVGGPGMGKTRLVDFVASVASREGARRVVLEHHSYDRNTPFHGWVPVVEGAFELRSVPTADERRARLHQALTDVGLQEHSSRFAALIGLHDEPVDDTEWKRTMSRALRELLDVWLSDRPLVLMAEDLHWCDPSSLELLDRLVRQPAPGLLLLFTSRQPVPMQEGAVEVVRLMPLSYDDVAAIGRSLGRGVPLADEEVEQLVLRSDGIPLYLDHLFAHARRGGSLWDVGVPEGLDALLGSIVGAPDVDQQFAGQLATMGRNVEPELVAAVLDTDVESVLASMTKLVDAGVLERRDDLHGSGFRFRHAMLQAAAYEAQLSSQRRESHARIAAALLRQRFTSEIDRASMARHLELAGDFDQAAHAYARAARSALRRGAALEARHLVEGALRAIDGLPEGPERNAVDLEANTILAQSLVAVDGYGAEGAIEAANRARSLIGSAGDALRVIQIETDRVSYYISRGDVERIDATLEAMRSTGARHPIAGAIAQQMEALELNRRGRFVESAELSAPLVEVYRKLAAERPSDPIGSPADGLVGLHAARASGLLQLGRQAEAHAGLDEADARALGLQASRRAFSQAYARATRAQLHLEVGDHARAKATAEESLDFCNRKGLQMWAGMNANIRLLARALLEPSEQHEAKVRSYLTFHESSGTVTLLPLFLTLHAEILRRLGAPEEALDRLDLAMTVADRSAERHAVAETQRVRSAVERELGRHDEARDSFRRATGVAAEQQARMYAARLVVDAADLDDELRESTATQLGPVLAGAPSEDPTPPISTARSYVDAWLSG